MTSGHSSDDERLVSDLDDASRRASQRYPTATIAEVFAARTALLTALRERAERVEELERENDVLRSSLLSS